MKTLKRNSNASTTCSTPPPTDIYSFIVSEESRYKRKGYGLISAFLIAISFFYFSPIVAKMVWPSVLNAIEEN